jgi:indole-3-glycerol phosphate synthase
MQDTSWLQKDNVQETNRPQADQWRDLVTALENCDEQLRRVRVDLAELKRTGPREGLDRLKFNQPEIAREIETIRVLASSCALTWSTFDPDNVIVPRRAFSNRDCHPQKESETERTPA